MKLESRSKSQNARTWTLASLPPSWTKNPSESMVGVNIAISLMDGFEGYGLITTLITSKANIICPGYLIDSCSSKKRRPAGN
jgi:hypothetical protein